MTLWTYVDVVRLESDLDRRTSDVDINVQTKRTSEIILERTSDIETRLDRSSHYFF